MATRLVAFADVMGSPRKVRIGTEKSDPPPPTVLRKAAPKPVIIMRGISYSSIGREKIVNTISGEHVVHSFFKKITPSANLLKFVPLLVRGVGRGVIKKNLTST